MVQLNIMNNYALVINGIVTSMFQSAQNASAFPDIAANLVIVPSNVQCGWLTNDNVNFSAPTPPQAAFNSDDNASFVFGLMAEILAFNNARGLTVGQRVQLSQVLAPAIITALSGDFPTVLAYLPNINVDGVIVTAPLIALITSAVQAYVVAGG